MNEADRLPDPEELARCTDSARSLALQLLRDASTAEDAAQEAWLAALEGSRPAEVPLRWWLRGIVRHIAWRYMRSESRRKRHERSASRAESVDSAAEAAARRAEMHRELADAVLSLDEPYRTAVLLRFFDGLTSVEIAERTGERPGTVRVRLKRALDMLRTRLDHAHQGERRTWALLLVPLLGRPRAAGTTAALVGGGAAVTAITKAGFAAVAAVLLVAGVAAWRSTQPASIETSALGPDAPTQVAATKPTAPAHSAKERAGTAAVFGEVWRRSPEAPAAGVAVRLVSAGDVKSSVVADERGRFRFDDLPAGTRGSVRVATDAEVVIPAAVAPLLPGEVRSVGVLWLEPSGKLDVVVTTLDGKPIAGARVDARSPGVFYPGVTFTDPASASATWRDVPDPVATSTTDAAGRATVGGLAHGRWIVDVSKQGFVAGYGGGDVGAGAAPTVRVALRSGTDLRGRVEDRAGRPVAGLVVRAHREGGAAWAQTPSVPHATTGTDGRFELTGLESGTVQLSLARRGESPTVVGSFRVPTSQEVRLVAGGPTISGRVVDADAGTPVAAVRVRAYSESWTEAVTDEHGSYALSFLAEHVVVHDVRVEKAGYVFDGSPRRDARGLLNLRGDETAKLDLKMRRAEGLQGTVTHAGAPVRNARVTGLRGSPRGIESASTTTDGDGRYALDGVAGQTLLIQVQAPGLVQPEFPLDVFGPLTSGKRVPRWSVDVPRSGGATLDVELVAGEDVSGRVLGPGDAPLEGARVSVGGVSTTSAPDGSFALHGVDLRGTSVSASKQGYTTVWAKPEGSLVTIRLARRALVQGTVRAEGGSLEEGWVEWAPKPVEPETYYMPSPDRPPPPVRWDGRRADVASDGSFEIPVATGAILLRAGGRRHGPSAPVDLTVADDGRPATATIDLSAVVSIRGQVTREDGAAVAGARIELDPAPRRGGLDDGRPAPGVTAAYTDAEGRFEIPSATPGTHRVFVDADGFLPATVDGGAGEVLVRLSRSAEIRGAIVWSDGSPVDLAMVTVFPKGMPSPFGGPANNTPYFTGVSRMGSFRVVLPPGTYTAFVSASENNSFVSRRTFEDVASGSTDLKFVIDLGPTIVGRVVGADNGAPLARATIDCYAEDGRRVAGVTADEDGRFRAEAQGTGPFTLVALSSSGDRSYSSGFVHDKKYLRGVARGVTAGASGVELRLPVGAEIAGTLVDGAGAPVIGRWVVARRLSKWAGDPLSDDGWMDRGARTDMAGRFVLTGLEADSFRLFAAEESGPRRTPLGGGESVASGAREVRVVHPGTAAIAGRVVDETGAPFAGISVTAKPQDGSTFYTATTQEDGTFAVKGVAAFGTYEVSAGVNERAPVRALDVAPGTTGVVLRLTRGLHASGRALDAAGKPLPRATLIFKIENGRREAQIITDADGRFVIDNLLPGAYRVENFVFRDGKGVYLPCGGLSAGDDGVELRRSE